MKIPATNYNSSRLWKLRATDFSDSYKAVAPANIATWKSSPAVGALTDASTGSVSGGYCGNGATDGGCVDGGVYINYTVGDTSFTAGSRINRDSVNSDTLMRGSPPIADIDGDITNGYEVIVTTALCANVTETSADPAITVEGGGWLMDVPS
jgi:hypothetical protein